MGDVPFVLEEDAVEREVKELDEVVVAPMMEGVELIEAGAEEVSKGECSGPFTPLIVPFTLASERVTDEDDSTAAFTVVLRL